MDQLDQLKRDLIARHGMNLNSMERLLRAKPGINEQAKQMGQLVMLASMIETSPDLRFQAFLQVLIEVHGLSPQTVASLCGMASEEVETFLKSPQELPLTSRYQLGAAIMTLRFLFQDAEPPLA